MQPPQSKPDDFLPQRAFPAEAAERDRLPARKASGGAFSQYVLMVVLFVVIVGGIAWVVQNLPKWRTNAPAPGPEPNPNGSGKPVVEFSLTRAKWDKDSDYVKESEKGVPGHYDFPFRNTSGAEAELGLFQPSCDCVSIQACLLDKYEWEKADQALKADPGMPIVYSKEPAWQELKPVREEDKGIVIPPDGCGVVRVNWNGRKDPGRPLNLTPRFWSQPKGQHSQRYDKDTLIVPIVMVNSIQYYPDRASVGTLASRTSGRAEFYIWSVTRDTPNVKVENFAPDPLFDVQTRRLSDAEIPGLVKRLEAEGRGQTRIRAAYQVTVTVYEQKDGKEMDLGPFMHTLNVLLDEQPIGGGPMVTGIVRGDIEVGGTDDQGKIKLKAFAAPQGTREVVSLWSDGKVNLEVQSATPAGLEVKLSKLEKETTPGRAKWRMEVVAPPDAIPAGTFADDSAILLRISSTPPRLVRIPVLGHALAN